MPLPPLVSQIIQATLDWPSKERVPPSLFLPIEPCFFSFFHTGLPFRTSELFFSVYIRNGLFLYLIPLLSWFPPFTFMEFLLFLVCERGSPPYVRGMVQLQYARDLRVYLGTPCTYRIVREYLSLGFMFFVGQAFSLYCRFPLLPAEVPPPPLNTK